MSNTREEWLVAAVEEFRPMFADAGFPLCSKIRVSCAFPTTFTRSGALGQAFPDGASADRALEVMVAPSLDQPRDVVAVLVAQLCHATNGALSHATVAYQKAVEALEEQLANALRVFDATPSVVQPTQDVILRLDKIEERLTMKILPPDLTARALALAHSVCLSNNGRADSTDVEAVDALHRAGYVVGLSAHQHPALPVNWTVSTREAWEAKVRSMIGEVSA